MTNGDEVRSMNDEQLAQLFSLMVYALTKDEVFSEIVRQEYAAWFKEECE